MSNTTTTTNMSLILPNVSQQTGPAYANNINTSLTTVDSHDHSNGKGVQITPSGININADLPFNGYNATLLRTSRYSAQSAAITGSSTADLNCTYVAGVDLYYNDGSGNQVRITQSGGVAGSPGSITGLASPASATYVSANSTFVWQSAANTAASLDARNVLLRNSSASSNALTLSPPAAMGSNFTLTLPTAPASQSFVTIDASGSFATPITYSGGIVGSNIAATTIARTNLIAVGEKVSDSCQAFTTTATGYGIVNSMTCAITTTGRPVMLMVRSDGSTNNSAIGTQVISGSNGVSSYAFFRDAVQLSTYMTQIVNPTTRADVPSSSLNFLDRPGAGSYTYTLRVKSDVGATTTLVSYSTLCVYEL